MTHYIRTLGTSLALSAAFVLASCSTADKKPDSSLARDSSLNRDLQLAGKDTMVQPQLKDVPATPASGAAPLATASAPRPASRSPGRPPTT